MSFGFPAHHEETVNVASRDLDLLVERACRVLDWVNLGETAYETWLLKVPMSAASWGERLTVRRLETGRVLISSRCALPTQCLDFGKNRQNVEKLRTAFEELESAPD